MRNQQSAQNEAYLKLKIFTAGAVAGLLVDTALFPIDTIKSRMQSEFGLIGSGGLKNLYRGLPAILVGSIPNSAIFFLTYETAKARLSSLQHPLASQMIAAVMGETAACTIRVPYEVIKMRAQTSLLPEKTMTVFRTTLATEGVRGLYRGYLTTVAREAPFCMIQYPIWESLKARHSRMYRKNPSALQSGFYGSIAAGIAAFVTTPLDVAKSRTMLAKGGDKQAKGNITEILSTIFRERGIRGLFSGAVPRVTLISLGGAIFLGSYEFFMGIL
ncbi:S-adenosylmethionine mitochondrial carrier protein, partial [Fragariocoptes setiger]